jgi:hypothetical protein
VKKDEKDKEKWPTHFYKYNAYSRKLAMGIKT